MHQEKPPLHLSPLMLGGTGSDAGKSLLAAGLCRFFLQEGYHPAPFKAQNMSLNSFATPEGLELGRAQAVQAEAAGIAPLSDMNPVLLKPSGSQQSQVVLNGKPHSTLSAYHYYNREEQHKERFRIAGEAFDRLKARYNPIVMEGAGSIAELNLMHKDIANLRMACYAGACVFLVADIDRGGIFGSVYGTLALLPEADREMVKGIIVNKFRGDPTLFKEGKDKLEEITGKPVIGILPFLEDLQIEEEDSVALRQKAGKASEDKVNIAVILLKHLSNYTDFQQLEQDHRTHVYYTRQPEEIRKADITILPGSKNTVADLVKLKNDGISDAILENHRHNKTVIGICGGFQMMGAWLEDPDHIEGDTEGMPGLNLLPVHTRIHAHKKTEQCRFALAGTDKPPTLQGYEIHMGQTEVTNGKEAPLAILESGENDGYRLSKRCWGTYLHGILDNTEVTEQLLSPYTNLENSARESREAFKERQYNRLADTIREHLDTEQLYKILSTNIHQHQ